MKVGPSCRTHTPPNSYLLPAERVQGGVGVGAGGAAGGRGPLHPRHHGGGGHPHPHHPRPLQPHPDTDPLPHRRGAQYGHSYITIYTVSTLDSIGRGSSHNIEVGPWFSKSVPCTQHSWTKKSSIKVQEDAQDDIDCIH